MESLKAENLKSPEDNEIQARLGQIFTRASRLIEQAEFLFPEEAMIGQYSGEPLRPKPNPSFGFFYENKRYLIINGRRYKNPPPDLMGKVKTVELTGDDIQYINFGVFFSTLERLKLRLMKTPSLPKDCRLAIKKLDNGVFESIILDDNMAKLLNNEKTNDVNFANIPPAAAKLILEKRIALLGQSPIGAKASPSGEMRMFANNPPIE